MDPLADTLLANLTEFMTTTTTTALPALAPLVQPIGFAASVAIESLPLIFPNLDIRTGSILRTQEVLVFLLFVGSACAACIDVTNTMTNFYRHANAAGKQIEVLIVSAHRNATEFKSLVHGITNPFPAIQYGSQARLDLLADFGVDYASDGTFEPRVAVLEWLGARKGGSSRASVCPIDVYSSIQDLALPSLAKPAPRAPSPSGSRMGTPFFRTPSGGPRVELLGSQPGAVGFVQGLRERCNPLYPEMRDTLYQLRMRSREQVAYLRALRDVGTGMCTDAGTNTAVFNTAMDTIIRVSMNTRILEVIGAQRYNASNEAITTTTSVPIPGSTPTLSTTPGIRCEVMRMAVRRQTDLLAAAIKANKQYPPVSNVYHIKLQYRTREWSAIREAFPPSLDALRALAKDKISDAKLDVARFFSDELNPRMPLEANCENACDGVTAVTGSVQYTSFEDVREALTAARERARRHGGEVVKIKVVVIDSQVPLNDASPAANKAALMETIEAMMIRAAKEKVTEFSFLQSLLSTSVVMKLIELNEYQEEALRRVPVVRLHKEAVRDVLQYRKLHAGAMDSPALSSAIPPKVMAGAGAPSAPSAIGRHSRTNSGTSVGSRKTKPLAYPDALLRRLVAWFNGRFFSWLPVEIACQAGTDCEGAMPLCFVAQVRDQTEDEDGAPIEHPVLQNYIIENFACTTCYYQFQLLRPVHDVVRMIAFSQGRCGEHSKAFALMARSLGFDTRIVVAKFKERGESAPGSSDGETFTLFGDNNLEHSWNEVYSDAEGRWVHIDVSASDTAHRAAGAMGVPTAMRMDHPEVYDAEGAAGRLVIAGAASKDRVILVTNRYLKSAEAVQFAGQFEDVPILGSDMERLSHIVQGTNVNSATGERSPNEGRGLFLHHISTLEQVGLDNRLPDIPAPKVGKGGVFMGPNNLRIAMVGGEIPDFAKRPSQCLFSSYDKIMAMDGFRWQVCRVEVTTQRDIVMLIRFGYCFESEPGVPRAFSSSIDVFAITNTTGDSTAEQGGASIVRVQRPCVGSAGCVATIVAPGDFVARLDTAFNPSGTLSAVTVRLASELTYAGSADGVIITTVEPLIGDEEAPGTYLPILGVYGARRDPERFDIDFLGEYVVSPDQPEAAVPEGSVAVSTDPHDEYDMSQFDYLLEGFSL